MAKVDERDLELLVLSELVCSESLRDAWISPLPDAARSLERRADKSLATVSVFCHFSFVSASVFFTMAFSACSALVFVTVAVWIEPSAITFSISRCFSIAPTCSPCTSATRPLTTWSKLDGELDAPGAAFAYA